MELTYLIMRHSEEGVTKASSLSRWVCGELGNLNLINKPVIKNTKMHNYLDFLYTLLPIVN